MKWSARFFYLFLLIAVISMPAYLNKKSNGEYLDLDGITSEVSSWPRKFTGLFSSFVEPIADSEEKNMPADGSTYYRWQDATGAWHFSDEKPDGVSAEATQPGAVMTVPAIPIVQQPQVAPNQQFIQKHVDPLSVDSAVNVIENAKSAAAMMEQRQQALREIVGEE